MSASVSSPEQLPSLRSLLTYAMDFGIYRTLVCREWICKSVEAGSYTCLLNVRSLSGAQAFEVVLVGSYDFTCTAEGRLRELMCAESEF